MSDLFLCYSRKDKTLATRLRERLRAEGWEVFMDLHVEAGHRWSEQIQRELAAARAVVTLWSSHSVRSRFVLDEANEAAEREILFPARIEDIPIPYGFRQFQTLDLIGWNGEGHRDEWQSLLGTLRKHLGTPETAGTTPAAAVLKPTKPPADETQAGLQADTAVAPAARAKPPKPPARPKARAEDKPPAPGQTFRDKLKDGGEGPPMVVIPAGRFLMGSPAGEPGRFDDEGPQHEVVFAKPFALGVYAVTFDDYDRFCERTKREKPDDRGWGRAKRPAINVYWDDAQEYCRWLTEQTGRAYRLPSEAEWEYACRAGTTTPFHFGERITTDQANFDGNYTYNGSAKGEYREKTVEVGTFPPNAFGLYDMHGNVWEWCQDRWHRNYEGAPGDGSAWESGSDLSRVVRGGAWGGDPRGCRAAYRYYFASDSRFDYLGFRVCCGAPIEPLGAGSLDAETLAS